MLASRTGQASIAILVRPGPGIEGLIALASLSIKPSGSASGVPSIAAERCSTLRNLTFSSTVLSPALSCAESHGTATSLLPRKADRQTADHSPAALGGFKLQAARQLAGSLSSPFKRSFASDKISELEAGETKGSTPADQPAAKPTVEQLQPAQLLKVCLTSPAALYQCSSCPLGSLFLHKIGG